MNIHSHEPKKSIVKPPKKVNKAIPGKLNKIKYIRR